MKSKIGRTLTGLAIGLFLFIASPKIVKKYNSFYKHENVQSVQYAKHIDDYGIVFDDSEVVYKIMYGDMAEANDSLDKFDYAEGRVVDVLTGKPIDGLKAEVYVNLDGKKKINDTSNLVWKGHIDRSVSTDENGFFSTEDSHSVDSKGKLPATWANLKTGKIIPSPANRAPSGNGEEKNHAPSNKPFDKTGDIIYLSVSDPLGRYYTLELLREGDPYWNDRFFTQIDVDPGIGLVFEGIRFGIPREDNIRESYPLQMIPDMDIDGTDLLDGIRLLLGYHFSVPLQFRPSLPHRIDFADEKYEKEFGDELMASINEWNDKTGRECFVHDDVNPNTVIDFISLEDFWKDTDNNTVTILPPEIRPIKQKVLKGEELTKKEYLQIRSRTPVAYSSSTINANEDENEIRYIRDGLIETDFEEVPAHPEWFGETLPHELGVVLGFVDVKKR